MDCKKHSNKQFLKNIDFWQIKQLICLGKQEVSNEKNISAQ